VPGNGEKGTSDLRAKGGENKIGKHDGCRKRSLVCGTKSKKTEQETKEFVGWNLTKKYNILSVSKGGRKKKIKKRRQIPG